jgi:protein-S-isoprenylcysteine O-methyltransferase Ste14
MKMTHAFHVVFLSNPFYRGIAEKMILLGTGICGLVFSWKTCAIFPGSHILGGILVLLAYAFHRWTEQDHRQTHQESQEIEHIVTTGVFSKIRHPLYLSLMAMNIGIALAFGVMMTFVFALLTILHWVITALEEEAVLLKKFPDEYTKYMHEVRWRMIPGIF